MCYSYRNVSTGFFVANCQLCQLTIVNAIIETINPEPIKIQTLIVVLYAKFSSHLIMMYQAIGQAIRNAVIKLNIKPLFNVNITSHTCAPLIFLIPISFTLLSHKKIERLNIPRIAMVMAIREKYKQTN